MGRRSDHSREELYEMALSAAREIVGEFGLDGLTIRRLTLLIPSCAGHRIEHEKKRGPSGLT